MQNRLKILFVCGRNKRRSPTAEKLFQTDPRVWVKSAGTSDSSARKIKETDLRWADLVLVMERKYAERIKALFPNFSPLPKIQTLEIPDDFEFMDPELKNLLRQGLDHVLESNQNPGD